jgi:hypothetical protein
MKNYIFISKNPMSFQELTETLFAEKVTKLQESYGIDDAKLALNNAELVNLTPYTPKAVRPVVKHLGR